MDNINIAEEAQKPFFGNEDYEAYFKKAEDREDLHSALRSCKEIGQAVSLFTFILNVHKSV